MVRRFSRHPRTRIVGLCVVGVLSVLRPAAGAAVPTEDGAARPEAAAADSAAAEASDRPDTEIRDLLMVTGGAAAAEAIPGSSHFLGRLELERQAHSDIHRVLGQVEGVTLQEEDGFGLRPNIGMRGTGVSRSEKVTLLEDGVLIAPAPYSAPAAYYFPVVERMEAVEVRKGSSTISQGPYTTGGVINLVTSAIPGSLSSLARAAVGSHDLAKLRGRIGGTGARLGWLAEGYRFASSGFKELDGGGSTGVVLEDYLGKLRWSSRAGSRRQQSFEVKAGRTWQDGKETYLGLTADDFALTPLRRYAASRQDSFESRHSQTRFQYVTSFGASGIASAVLYRNGFERDWYKLQSVAGVGLAAVLDDPELFAAELAMLRGEIGTQGTPLALRHNRREYLSQGLDVRLSVAAAGHEIEIGARAHGDEEDRFQEEDSWDIIGGRMVLAARGLPGSQSNRIASAEALAFFLSDTIRLGRLTLIPGLRFERIDFERRDFGRADPARLGADLTTTSNDVEVLLPGVSASYGLAQRWTVFAGLHRGFAAPGPGQDPRTDAEESTNGEVGVNFRSRHSGARFVAFLNDYSNLIGRDTLAAGGEGTGATFNGGAATVSGLEASLDTDLGRRFGRSYGLPLRLGYTLTSGRFDSSFDTAYADWAPSVVAGDRLPYVPRQRLTLAAGWETADWSAFLDASWTDEIRIRPGRGPAAADEAIASVLLVDLALQIPVGRGLDLSLQARNVLDESYLAARRPAGLRPGMPRTLLAGLRWRAGGAG